MSEESNCFMSTSFIPHTKVDIVHPSKHKNIYRLCPWMHHDRNTNMLSINLPSTFES